MRRTDDTDRHRIGDGAVQDRDQALQSVAIPGAARDLDEGAALRGGLEVAFARRREGGGEFSDLAQRLLVGSRGGTMRMRQKHPVTEAGSLEQRTQPILQRYGIGDV